MRVDIGISSYGIEHTFPALISNPKLENVKDYLQHALPKLSKWELEAITTQVRQVYVNKYHHSKLPRYGGLDKCFNDEQISKFFEAIDDDKFYLMFRYQAVLGLRIGEAVKLNLANLQFKEQELRLRSEKSGRLDLLRIPDALFQETLRYIRNYKEGIEKAQGYLFFPNPTKQGYNRRTNFIDVNYARNMFRRYIQKANLDNDTYDFSNESDTTRTKRKLHLLSSHSLRHYAISRMAKVTNGNLVTTSRFARHADPSTTMIYIARDKEALYRAIDSVSISDVEALKMKIK